MKIYLLQVATFCLALCAVDAFSLKSKQAVKPIKEIQKAGISLLTAFTIASSAALAPPLAAEAALPPLAFPSSSLVVAEKEVREGFYGEYTVDVSPQKYDDARSTFKPAGETKSKKGKYTALLAILIVGSFIIPMAQYFWYVRDDDSSDKFFASNVPEPEEPPKKKGWF